MPDENAGTANEEVDQEEDQEEDPEEDPLTYRFLYFNLPGPVESFLFKDKAAAEHWMSHVRELKDRCAASQYALQNGTITAAAHRNQAAEWLNLVAAFAQQFGNDYVPPDIKTAVNSTEEFLGQAQTNW